MAFDAQFRKFVAAHTDQIVKRAESMACKIERDNVRPILCYFQLCDGFLLYLFLKALASNAPNTTLPVVQTVTNLISAATNPVTLAKMGELYQPWF